MGTPGELPLPSPSAFLVLAALSPVVGAGSEFLLLPPSASLFCSSRAELLHPTPEAAPSRSSPVYSLSLFLSAPASLNNNECLYSALGFRRHFSALSDFILLIHHGVKQAERSHCFMNKETEAPKG